MRPAIRLEPSIGIVFRHEHGADISQTPPREASSLHEDSAWPTVLCVYGLYALITVAGAAIGVSLQSIGVALFLAFIAVRYGVRLAALPLDPLIVAIGVVLVVPVFSPLLGAAALDGSSAGYWAKHYAMYGLMLLALAMKLPALSRSRYRAWGLGTALGVLVVGLAIDHVRNGDADRLQGVFVNPNNLALAAMSLLFFSDHQRDSRWLTVGIHAAALGFMLLSGTAGALLGYGAGLLALALRARWRDMLERAFRTRAGLVVLLGMLLVLSAAIAIGGLAPGVLKPVDAVSSSIAKLKLAYENIDLLRPDTEINYWQLGRANGGAAVTSALWRLAHWRDVLVMYREGGPARLAFGYGLGSSDVLTGTLPHNDYLRLLFEGGAIGLASVLAVWVLVYRRMRPASRWVLVMLGTFAFTENNLDNFLVMSLLVLFVASACSAWPEEAQP